MSTQITPTGVARKTLIIQAHADNGTPSWQPFAIVQIGQTFIDTMIKRAHSLKEMHDQQMHWEFNKRETPTLMATVDHTDSNVHFPRCEANNGSWGIIASPGAMVVRFVCTTEDMQTADIALNKLVQLYESVKDQCVGVYARDQDFQALSDAMSLEIDGHSNEQPLKDLANGHMPEHFLNYMYMGTIACQKALDDQLGKGSINAVILASDGTKQREVTLKARMDVAAGILQICGTPVLIHPLPADKNAHLPELAFNPLTSPDPLTGERYTEFTYIDDSGPLFDFDPQTLRMHGRMIGGEMSRQAYLSLQAKAESMGLDGAKGQNICGDWQKDMDLLMHQLDSAPWTLHPDHGCIRRCDVQKMDAWSAEAPSA